MAKLNKKWKKLFASIGLDLMGNVSYVFDAFGFLVLGEISDVVFAPISTYLEYKLYHNIAFATFNFAEEIAPYTDIIPTATINWFYEYYIKG